MSETLSDNPHAALSDGSGVNGASEPSLQITGFVPQPLNLGLKDLRHLPSRVLGPTEIVCMTGRHIENVDGYRGVSLVDVLALTGLPNVPRAALKECVVVAHGGDGYRALFSWIELHNTAIGAGVLVVYEKNFRPLDERSGPLGLISSADTRLGPRHLRQLREIAVLRLGLPEFVSGQAARSDP